MKQYFGNYLGMVINNADPEYRGRVQVFIPHIMPALYEGWNKEGTDIQISCVGSNIPEGLSPEIHQRLIQILPWAEAASPIIGGSSPGNLTPAAIGGMIGGMLGGAVAGAAGQAAGQAIGQAIGGTFDQSPTVKPATIPGELGAIYNEAQNYLGSKEALDYQRNYFQKYGKYDTDHPNYGLAGKGLTGYNGGGYMGACARGTVAALGAMTGNAAFKQGSAGGNADDYSLGRSAPNDVFAKSGLYQAKQPVPANYVPQVGDVIACDGGTGFGHIQTYTGVGSKPWTSDTPQENALLGSKYYNCALHRATPEAQNGMKAKLDSLYGQGASGALGGSPNETTAESAAPAMVPKHLNKEGQTPTTAPTPPATSGMTAGGPGTGTPAGTMSGGGTVSETGISKEALEYAMRMAASESGAGVLPSGEVMKNITDPDLMLGYSYNSYAKKAGVPTVSWNGVKRTTEDVRQLGRQARALPGFNPNSMDLGYTQHNLNDASRYSLTNSGSYKDQVLSVARHVQNQANANPGFAAALQNASKDGTFSKAEEMNAIPGWNISEKNVGSDRYNEYMRKKGLLSERIDSKFGGDPFAALEAIDKENPATPTANEMLGTNYTAPAAGTAQGYSGTGGPSVVNNTDPGGLTTVYNTNDMAKGMFSYPNPGAMVWVFFREGNPLFPVYFAASYSASEWSSVYKTSSNSEDGMSFGSINNTGITSQKSALSLEGGNTIFSLNTVDHSNPLESKSVLAIQGNDGSNMMISNGQHQLYTRHNRRDQVDRDRFETTMGFKEQWVEGDYNTNIRGNLKIKVGKFDKETMDALQQLAKISSETNKQLTQSS